MRKTVALAVLVSTLLFLVASGGLRAQERVPEDRLQEEFFGSLKRPQIVSLLETLDETKQLTDFELGAKYRWGYIPPDRRPPVSVARWWRSKSQGQRSNLRVEWFKNHFDQLPLDRSARELGLRDRLTRIHRELESQLGNRPGELEAVEFPGDTPEPTMSTPEDTEYEAVYRQTDDTEKSPASASPGSADRTSGSPEESDGGTEPDDRKTERGTESADPEDSREPEEKNPDTSPEESDADDSVRYRRVGDRIEVVERTSAEPDPEVDVEPDTKPAPANEEEPSSDSFPSDTSPPAPNLLLDNTGTDDPSVRLPEPSLRGGSDPTPKLRRSGGAER